MITGIYERIACSAIATLIASAGCVAIFARDTTVGAPVTRTTGPGVRGPNARVVSLIVGTVREYAVLAHANLEPVANDVMIDGVGVAVRECHGVPRTV